MGSPGPGPAYLLPSTIGYDKHDQRYVRNPQYTIAGRLKERKAELTPGPGLNTQGFTRYGRAISLAYSMATRTFAKEHKTIGPGPANYDVSKKPYVNMAAPPAYSLGRRNNIRTKIEGPAPNAYAVKDKMVRQSAPGYSIGIKPVLKSTSGSPGPASYPASNLKVTMHKSPEYSLYGRTKISTSNKTIVPGANAYDRRNYKPGKSSPAYSFGTRHSPRAPPLIVPCDNV